VASQRIYRNKDIEVQRESAYRLRKSPQVSPRRELGRYVREAKRAAPQCQQVQARRHRHAHRTRPSAASPSPEGVQECSRGAGRRKAPERQKAEGRRGNFRFEGASRRQSRRERDAERQKAPLKEE